MTITNHAATGALVAAAINRPWLSLPAAVASHFVIDMVPHWDYKVKKGYLLLAMMLDLTLCLYLLMVLSVTVDASPRLIIAGGLLAILPDTMWIPYFMTEKSVARHKNTPLHILRRLHIKIQWSETRKGLFVEIAWFMAVVFLIYNIHK